MGIVRRVLRRANTFVVMAMMIVVLSVVAML
jgi:hypothetical protein